MGSQAVVQVSTKFRDHGEIFVVKHANVRIQSEQAARVGRDLAIRSRNDCRSSDTRLGSRSTNGDFSEQPNSPALFAAFPVESQVNAVEFVLGAEAINDVEGGTRRDISIGVGRSQVLFDTNLIRQFEVTVSDQQLNTPRSKYAVVVTAGSPAGTLAAEGWTDSTSATTRLAARKIVSPQNTEALKIRRRVDTKSTVNDAWKAHELCVLIARKDVRKRTSEDTTGIATKALKVFALVGKEQIVELQSITAFAIQVDTHRVATARMQKCFLVTTERK